MSPNIFVGRKTTDDIIVIDKFKPLKIRTSEKIKSKNIIKVRVK